MEDIKRKSKIYIINLGCFELGGNVTYNNLPLCVCKIAKLQLVSLSFFHHLQETSSTSKVEKKKTARKLSFAAEPKVTEIHAENKAGPKTSGDKKKAEPEGMSDSEARKLIMEMKTKPDGAEETESQSEDASGEEDDSESESEEEEGSDEEKDEEEDEDKEEEEDDDDEKEEESGSEAGSDEEDEGSSKASQESSSSENETAGEDEDSEDDEDESEPEDNESDSSEDEPEVTSKKALKTSKDKRKDETLKSEKKAEKDTNKGDRKEKQKKESKKDQKEAKESSNDSKKEEAKKEEAKKDEKKEARKDSKKKEEAKKDEKKEARKDSKKKEEAKEDDKKKESKTDPKKKEEAKEDDKKKESKTDPKKEDKVKKSDKEHKVKKIGKDDNEKKTSKEDKKKKKHKEEEDTSEVTKKKEKKETKEKATKLAEAEDQLANTKTTELDDSKINSNTHHKEYLRYRRWIRNGKRFPTTLGSRLTTEEGRAKLFVDWVKLNGDVDAIICKHEQSLSESQSSSIKYGFRSEKWLKDTYGDSKAERILKKKKEQGLTIEDPEDSEDSLYFVLVNIDFDNINELKKVTSLEAKGSVSEEMIKAFTDAGGVLDPASLKLGGMDKSSLDKAMKFMGSTKPAAAGKSTAKPRRRGGDTEASQVQADTPQSKAKALITKVLKDANTCRRGTHKPKR